MRLAAVILTLAFSSATGNERAMDMLRDWIVAIDAHVAGQPDAALARVSGWTYDDLDLVQGYVEALVGVPTSSNSRAGRRNTISKNDLAQIRKLTTGLQAGGNFDRFRKRAVMLHTDAALFGSAPVVVDPPPATRKPRSSDPPARRVDVLSHDGRTERYELANPHWVYARLLLESLPVVATERDPLVGQWYRAIGAHFLVNRAFAEALAHFSAARDVVADDPGVLYGEACLQEVFGAPRIQDYVRIAMTNGVNILGVSSPRSHHRRAEELLRRALARRPDFADAHLRLGRVLVEQRIYDEALTHFRQVVASTRDSTLGYYAYLFTGDAEMALGHVDDARAAYDRALDLYPSSQAAHLGLAAALRVMGDRQAALDAVMSTLTLPADSRTADHEPWWDYYDGDAAGVIALLDELRRPFRERVP